MANLSRSFHVCPTHSSTYLTNVDQKCYFMYRPYGLDRVVNGGDYMQEKSFARKKELIAAALAEFTTKSFDEASLNQIIKNAGISKGTFYYHFKDKQELYLLLLKHGLQAKWVFINNAMEETTVSQGDNDIFENFKLQARMAAKFAEAFPEYHLLSQMFVGEKGNEIYEIAMNALGAGVDLPLEAMIDEAIGRGDFREGFSRDFIVRILTHLFANFYEIFQGEDDFEMDQVINNLDDYVYFLKHGLGRD